MASLLRSRLSGILLSASLLLLAGCQSDTVTGENPRIPATTSSAQLRPGDSLTIALQGIPDPSAHPVQIDEQGLISLPYIGTISAANSTTGELAQRIRETYIARNFYTAMDVSVSVTERYIYVGGEVTRPGRIIWTPDLTLAKAIQSAGGFTLYARETRVSLVRDQQAYDLNVKLAQRNPAQDPLMMPGDSVQVPRSPF
ncbi:MAG TPA: polysaccharide biosynthesis/export family protein [Opitutaceae bacterium]|nr:polysaccharide biosynthesis/export family protein [Opitutaceae bacterium]HRJ47826.1 polysaccharide biosynthesis/export family protein [Opitutaceae bacterium]